jgi:hypothetical protein
MRPDTWTALLDNYIECSRLRRFEWGSFDCVTFAGNWKALVTGADPLASVRGTYSSERGALETIVRLGCNDLESVASHFFGEPDPLGPKFAGRGDIVLAQGALGISLGARGAFLSLSGLELIPARQFQTVWKV